MESLLAAAWMKEIADAVFASLYLHWPPSEIVPPPEIVNPPPVIVWPPFTLMVDAFRVEGMPLPPPGTYGTPLIVFTLRLFVLMVVVLIESALIAFPT